MNILEEEQAKKLILSFADSRGDKGFTDEEAAKVIAWAEEAIIAHALLENVLAGWVSVNLDGEGEVVFEITKSGEKIVEDNFLTNVQSKFIQ